MSHTGTVTSFNRATGSGTLQPDGDGPAITFWKDDFRQAGGDPRERQRLCYDLVTDSAGHKRPMNIRLD
jgi:cold shock CspA family protein